MIEKPRFKLRMLNHWDNLDGTIERGYAGKSLWNWKDTAGHRRIPRLTDYARANASLGINGTVLNNVNANARSLTPEYLKQDRCDRRRLPPLRPARLSIRPFFGTHRDWKTENRRST